MTKLVVIVGPTAVGKTALSLHLAKLYHGEVINADALQVYQDIKIGTARPSLKEQAGIPHHLFGCLPVQDQYSADVFQQLARQKIAEVAKRGRLPILVGGTGLYVEGVIYQHSFGGQQSNDATVRHRLTQQAAQEGGAETLWQRLSLLDPKAAEKIPQNNTRRVIRALEVIEVTGQLFSNQTSQAERRLAYDTLTIGLDTHRHLLYERINQRVDQMVMEGLEAEAYGLYQLSKDLLGGLPASKGIGYKEWYPYFKQEISRQTAIDQIKQNSRRYAKRQLTWFRNRLAKVHWFDLVNEERSHLLAIQALVENFLNDPNSGQ